MSGDWFGLASDEERADMAVFGLAYDGAVFFRPGAADGPERIRRLSSKIPPVAEDGTVLAGRRVRDLGDVVPTQHEARETGPRNFFARARETWRRARSTGLPMALGGDHSVSIPLFLAAGDVVPEFGVLWLDAHPDLCDTYQDSPYSHACVLRRALEIPHLRPERVVLVGTRSFEVEEVDVIRDRGLSMYTAQQTASLPPSELAGRILDQLAGVPVYLSIDIDAFDPAYAPGTGIPDAGGLTSRYVLDLLRELRRLDLLAADIVEVAPSLDAPSDPTSLLALKLVLELLGLYGGSER